MSNVNDADCHDHRKDIYTSVNSRVGKKTFWAVLSILVGIAITVLSAIGGISISHAMNGGIHIDERYPLVTKEVFQEFKTEQNRRFDEVITEVKKANGNN
jgi:hypothetical protein